MESFFIYIFKKRWLPIFVISAMISSTIFLMYLWFLAFFNGYTVTMDINVINEAYFELVMYALFIPCAIHYGIIQYKHFIKDAVKLRKQYSRKTNTKVPVRRL